MSRANPLWGAPRIHGELLKLGLTVSQATVSKYKLRPRRPPSQAWRAFLKNHAKDLIALDFFTVPTATFRVLFVLVVLSHARRRLVHFNVTEHPTAEWTARQLLQACGLEEAPQYLLRDRDRVYRERFWRQAKTLGIREVVIAPRSPWQNAYAERVIGSIRRECLDYVVVVGEWHLLRILSSYVAYYNGARTHLSLIKDAPEPRSVCSHRVRGGWWRCRASVGFITSTCDARREPIGRISGRHRLVMIALLAGCATQQKAQSDRKTEWTGLPPVQVDSCTGRREDLTPAWHWYDYLVSIPLGNARVL